MPLPWKKEKPKKSMNRSLSRFINEIRASKRGESLVVETGFPTSLIDLIVKNRNRFNASTKKHRDSQTPQSCENTPRQPNTHPHPHPHLAPLILNSINTLLSESESNDDSVLRETADKNFSEDDCVVNKLELREIGIQVQDQDSEVEVSVRKDRIFMVAVKLLVVLILALSTKKFAISITLSAFVLLFLEILFKSFVNEYRKLTVSVHFEGGERRLSLIDVDDDIVVANFVEGVIDERMVTEIELEDSEVKGDKVLAFSSCDRSVVADVEIGKPRRTVSDKLRAKFKKLGGELKNRKNKKDCKLEESNVESTTKCVIEDGGEDEEDVDRSDDGSVGNAVESNQENLGAAKRKDDVVYGTVERRRSTVSTKVRAKQFVKKLGDDIKHRRNKKERKLGQNTVQSTQEETTHEGEEQEKDKEVADDHNEEDAEVEETDDYDLINISEASSDLGCPKRIGRRRKWSWSTSILVVIVLAGLVGGRIMALILSILCLLLHKIVGAN